MASSGVAASNQVVKAGWLQRESEVLKRWKPSYCVLKTNGILTYFNNEFQTESQGQINLPRDTFNLKIGQDVVGMAPPHGHHPLSLIEIRTSQATTIFCAESPDDAQMWKLVIDDIIRAHRAPRPVTAPQPATYMAPPPPYAPVGVSPAPGYYPSPAPGYPTQAPMAPPPAYVYNAPPQQVQIIPAPTPAPVTVITPGSSSRRVTSTTYHTGGQTVTTVRRGASSAYPVQQTVYSSYPGQTVYSSYPGQTVITPGLGGTVTYGVPNQTTTTVYRNTYY